MDPVTPDVSAVPCYTFRTQVSADGSVGVNQVALDSLAHDISRLQDLLRSHPEHAAVIKQRLEKLLLANERVRLLLVPGMSQVVPILIQVNNRLKNLENLQQRRMPTSLETMPENHIRETNVQSSFLACMHNEKQLALNGAFMPVVAWIGANLGQRPASFPANMRDFNALTAAQVTTLLTFYGFPVDNIRGAVERKERLL